MKLWYKILHTTVIENDSGTYEVWAEKYFCLNRYLFHAKQVSVKTNGEHYHINNNLYTFKFHKKEKLFPFDSSFMSEQLPIKQYETKLNNYEMTYYGKLMYVKRELERFKRKVIYEAHNEIKMSW